MTKEKDNPIDKALEIFLKEVEKLHGKEAVLRFSDRPDTDIEVIPFGIISIDAITGIGGAPKGRFTEIVGLESSGKSSLCLHLVEQAQKMGGNVLYIDSEHALDIRYAAALGVDVDKMFLSQPASSEECLDIACAAAASGAISLIIIDSIAAMSPKRELEGTMDDSTPGLQARLMGQALRKLTHITAKGKTCVVFINQFRENINMMGWGTKNVTTGGKALKFYASLRIEITRTGTNKADEVAISNKTKVKTIKNKLAPPFQECEVEIYFGEGIDKYSDLINLGIEYKIIKKSGAWFTYFDQQFQGKTNFRDALKEDINLLTRLEEEVKGVMGLL